MGLTFNNCTKVCQQPRMVAQQSQQAKTIVANGRLLVHDQYAVGAITEFSYHPARLLHAVQQGLAVSHGFGGLGLRP